MYLSFKPYAQTNRMNRYNIKQASSSRHPSPSYHIIPLYSLSIQSYSHTCEFHQLPTRYPKMHPMPLLLWLLQVQPLASVFIKCCLKLTIKCGEIWYFKFISIDLNWHWLAHYPCDLVGSTCVVSITIARWHTGLFHSDLPFREKPFWKSDRFNTKKTGLLAPSLPTALGRVIQTKPVYLWCQ